MIDYTKSTQTENGVDPLTKQVIGANITFNPDEFDPTRLDYEMVFLKFGLHEIGHTFGLDHPVFQIAGNSVMNQGSGINDSNNNTAASIQPCDTQSVNRNPQCATPTPTLTPTPRPYICDNPTLPDLNGNCPNGAIADSDGYCCVLCGPSSRPNSKIGIEIETASDSEQPASPNPNSCCQDPYFQFSCQQNGGSWNYSTCGCQSSPIAIDVAGNGFDLTSVQNGVKFNLDAVGESEQLSWIAPGSDDAWLVLDRNNNNLIDNGRELFGNFTLQPAAPAGEKKNGFLALAVFDKPENGGNADGIINNQDAVFANLRLWQDSNHNGVSEMTELHTLTEKGIAELELRYKESKRTDEFGNQFKYRAKVKDARGEQVGRWAWDVYLVSAP